MKTLDELCELIVDCEHKTAPVQETGYPSIRTPNIGRGRFILDGVNRVSEETYQQWTRRAIPQPGDLIMAREAPVGNVAMIPEGLRPCLGQRTLLIRPDRSKVEPSFLSYFLNGPHGQGLIHGKTNGATVAHLNMKDVRSLPLPQLPPLPVQRRIAGILSAYDELIENSQRRIRLLEDMARTLYREWFVHFRFPGHESVPRIPSALGDIPQGWEVKTIGEICESVSYGYTASASRDEVGPKFLRITDIVPGTIDWAGVPFCEIAEEKAPKYLLKTGDIVVARTGATTGYAKRLNKLHPDTVFASYLVRARTKAGISSLMLGILMESDEYKHFIQRNMGGAAQPQANAVVLTSMQLAVPSSRIGEHFDRLVGPMIDESELLARKIQNLRRTRDLLLPRLLSGQVEPKEETT
jgi:type I restriction enzyme S subunit